jgi:hypothetical protein
MTNPWTTLEIDKMEPWTVSYTVQTATTEEQVCITPFSDAVGGKAYPIKIFLSNAQASAAVVELWDERLGQADPPARGQPGGSALYIFNVEASKDREIGIDKLPVDWIQGGLCIKSTQDAMFIKVEFAMSNNE